MTLKKIPIGWAWDVEADDLYLQSTKIWYIRLTSLDKTRSTCIHPFRMTKGAAKSLFMEWVKSFPDNALVVHHNGTGFDLWAIWKLLGIVPRVGKQGTDWIEDKPVSFVDTYVLSMYLRPDSPKHSLEYLADGSENEKMDFRQSLIDAGLLDASAPKGAEFKFWSEQMATYCDKDVEALLGVFYMLWKEAQELYGEAKWPHPSFRQMQKDYWLYQAQAYTGVLFNQEKAKTLAERVEGAMQALKDEVEPLLPPRPLKAAEEAFYRFPAKPWKKNGEFSSIMEKWLEKHSAVVLENGNVLAYGKEVPIVAGTILPVSLPMELDDNIELKDWFLSQGWVPHEDFWNHKKDPDTGKPLRDSNNKFIRTTPKIQHQGKICPNLLKIEGDIPKKVVKFLSYRNRLGVVQGWLSNWRLAFDGRLSAEISGYAPTSRVKHRTVVNVPKAAKDILLGEEMRDLFYVPEGWWYVGTDAAALENRTLASYTYKYDGGKFAEIQLRGDAHCYSEDTEILTLDGWKKFGEITKDSLVAQWNPSGTIDFVIPSSVVWQDYEGPMIHFKGVVVDSLVTPNHRVAVVDIKGNRGGFYVQEAEQVPVTNPNLRFPCSGDSTSSGIDLGDDEIRFLAATQADGYFAEDCTAIRFCFVKERKVERMSQLLKSLGVEYSRSIFNRKGRDEHKFYVKSSTFTTKMRSWLGQDKSLSTRMLGMSAEQCRVFVNEVALWDGTVNKSGSIVLDTSCLKSRDVVMGVAVLAGMRASANTYIKHTSFGTTIVHRVLISRKKETKVVSVKGIDKSTINYKGKIGCVTVPSSFVVVRRNGRVVISGNSFNAFAFFPHLHDKFDISDASLKDNPDFKPFRAKAKTGAYLLAFGGGAPKLASSLGLSKAAGLEAYNNYWAMNEGLGKLKEAVEAYYNTTGKKRYIVGKDGRIVFVRGKNVLISCIGQGLGAICMSYAACLLDQWLGELYIDDLGRPYYLYKGKKVMRVSMIHDEYSWQVEDGLQEEMKELTVKAIVRAGEILKLDIELAGEAKAEKNGSWRDTH